VLSQCLTKPDFCRLPTETCIETNFAQFFDSSTKMQAESRDAASDSESQDTRGIKRKLEAENENKDPKLIRYFTVCISQIEILMLQKGAIY